MTKDQHIEEKPVATEEKCKCACHENVLRKPYEHDTTCCDEMNGFIPPLRKDFVEGKPVATEEKHNWGNRKCAVTIWYNRDEQGVHAPKPRPECECTPTAPLQKDFVEGEWVEEFDDLGLCECEITTFEADSPEYSDESKPQTEILKDFIRKVEAQSYAQGAQDMLSRAKEAIRPEIKWEWEEIKDFDGGTFRTCKTCCHLENDPECPHSCEVSNAFRTEVLSALEALTPTP